MPDPVALLVALLVILIALLVVRASVGLITVFEFQHGLRYRSGRFDGLVGPGLHWYVRPTTAIRIVDARLSTLVVPGQEVVTADGISIKVSLAARTRLVDPAVAVNEVENYSGATYGYLQVALREAVGMRTIDQVLADRAAIGAEVLRLSGDRIRQVGMELSEVDVRDLILPGPTKKLFSQVVEARQQGLAALEKARAETAALRNLANAAKLVDQSPALLQLRLLQQLESTSGNTVVLGIPPATIPLPGGAGVTSEP